MTAFYTVAVRAIELEQNDPLVFDPLSKYMASKKMVEFMKDRGVIGQYYLLL